MTNRKIVPTIKVEDVLVMLKKGYTRYQKNDKGFGSIQEHYGINAASVTKLFKTEGLKFRKTISPSFIIEVGSEVTGDTSVPAEVIKEEILGAVVIDENPYA